MSKHKERGFESANPREVGVEQIASRPKVVVINVAKREGRKILNPGQYVHEIDLVKRLVDINDQEQMADMRIEAIKDFFELKDKGGVLGRINLRIYFGYFPDTNEIVVVKTRKKEEEDQVPRHVILNVQARLRAYRRGELRDGATAYEEESDFNDEQGRQH